MSQVEKLEIALSGFTIVKTVVITYKQSELYNAKLHGENMLLNALYNAVVVRLI